MKRFAAAAAFLTAIIAACPAGAVNAPTPRPVQSLYTCAAGGLSRVALTADPAACCTGAMNCPQLLSNTGLIKSKRVNRT